LRVVFDKFILQPNFLIFIFQSHFSLSRPAQMAIPKNTLPLLGRAVRSSQSRKSKSSTVQIGDQPLEPSNLLSNLLGPAAWRGGVSMFRVHTTGFLIGLVLLAHILSFGNAHAAEPLRQNIIWLSSISRPLERIICAAEHSCLIS